MAGAAVALGLYFASRREPLVLRAPSACSARRASAVHADGANDAGEAATPVSARVGTVPQMDAPSYMDDDAFSNMSNEGAAQMAQASVPRDGFYNARTQRAVGSFRAPEVEHKNGRSIGISVLSAGLCAERSAPRPTNVQGACLFNMSEAYAEELERRGIA